MNIVKESILAGVHCSKKENFKNSKNYSIILSIVQGLSITM
jgi:hypothetical protein